MSDEASRFQEAFEEELKAHPGRAPSPTALNRRLGKTRTMGTPLNVLNGRMNRLRKKLLLEAGFTQEHKWGRWT